MRLGMVEFECNSSLLFISQAYDKIPIALMTLTMYFVHATTIMHIFYAWDNCMLHSICI